jgi:sec-independent protein translocase protein TatC
MKQRKNQKKRTETSRLDEIAKPFIEHLYELRKRLVYVVGSIMLFSTIAYLVQQHIVSFLLKPSNGQQFIYTSPGGGINFLFSVCLYVGIAASMPVIVYQLLAFLSPLIHDHVRRSIVLYSFFSAILAIVGFCFGYFIGLPAALHFLSHQFTTKQIHSLFTLQEYMSFLTIYLLGSMLLFQLPIILLLIDHIKPLPPRKLFKAERYVILAAFIISMLMAPTANIFDQLIIAGPIILMYNATILLLWLLRKRSQQQNPNPIDGNYEIEETQPKSQKMHMAYRQPAKLIPINDLNVIQPIHNNSQLIMDIIPTTLKTSSNLNHPQKPSNY